MRRGGWTGCFRWILLVGFLLTMIAFAWLIAAFAHQDPYWSRPGATASAAPTTADEGASPGARTSSSLASA